MEGNSRKRKNIAARSEGKMIKKRPNENAWEQGKL